MKLIVGLGNVGNKYESTRHNVGFMALDKLVTSYQSPVTGKNFKNLATCYLLPAYNCVFAKPQTMMNASGKAVSSLAAYYKLPATSIYVVHDDLDIKLGEYKVQLGRGPKDHKGLDSIYRKLATKDFWHIRIGVDNRPVSRVTNYVSRISGEDYVLQPFTEKEEEILTLVLGKIVEELAERLLKTAKVLKN